MSENDDSFTPTTLPGKERARTGNGVPDHVEFENTGEIVKAVLATGASEDLMSAFVKKAAEHFATSTGGGGGDSPSKHAKSIKRHNWLAVIMAALLGPGGAIAVIYATSDRAKANTQEVEHLKDATKSIEPRMVKTEDDVRLIRVNVGQMKTSVDAVQMQQTDIASGIEELKKENVNRLKSELEDARRELRQERNR